MHDSGAYKLAGANNKHRRISRVFAYQSDPHVWSDQCTIRCLGQNPDGVVCDSGLSILHLLTLPRKSAGSGIWPAFSIVPRSELEGTSFWIILTSSRGTELKRSKRSRRQALRGRRTPSSLRVLHKPCRGPKGERFAVLLPSCRPRDHRQKS